MPTRISGIEVSTPDDLRRLATKIDQLDKSMTQIDKEARARSEEQASKIRVLQSDLKLQEARANKLEAALGELEKTLAAIGKEAERSSGLLVEANAHLSRSSEALGQVIAGVGEQAEIEAIRRQELAGQLEHALMEQRAQAGVLQQSLAGIQTGFGELTQAEQDGARQVERAIRVLREALVQVQSQVQEELSRTGEAVRGYSQAKAERAQQEAGAMEQLLALQERLGERLQAIQTAAGGLAASSGQAQAQQSARLAQSSSWRAGELNYQAALLLHRCEYEAATPLLEDAARLAPEDAAIAGNLALAYLRSGRPAQAEALLQQVLAHDPQSPIGPAGLGVLYLDGANPQAALPHLERAARLLPDDAAVWLHLGKAHYGCGAVAPALAAWRRAGQLEPALVANDVAVRILLEEQACLEA